MYMYLKLLNKHSLIWQLLAALVVVFSIRTGPAIRLEHKVTAHNEVSHGLLVLCLKVICSACDRGSPDNTD